ncbi:MAG: hypothetical protein JXJ04_17165 [Spirochaetales bacterium]|nr:hypothetical protein [Spirochaetales bacterium]
MNKTEDTFKSELDYNAELQKIIKDSRHLSSIYESEEETIISEDDNNANNINRTHFMIKIEELKEFKITPSEKTIDFICLQKWEGTIIEINGDFFMARLQDLTHLNNPQEIAEFPVDDVSKEDFELFRIGAIFYWYIGYTDSLQGQRERKSIIRFKRCPFWGKREIDRAKKKAKEFGKSFGWD